MARKPQPPQANIAPVRWTDEEWLAIADRIRATRGAAESATIDVNGIKAKDVFLAQDVLPESRHRKLISIQQGFDASRKRLGAQLSALPSSETGVAGTDGDIQAAAAAAEAPEVESRHTPGAATDHEDDLPNAAAGQPPAPEEPSGELQADLERPVRKDFIAGASGDAIHAHAAPRPQRKARHGEAGDNAARPASPQADLVELARPFVAMVCEELANAFVRALGDNAGTAALRAAIGAKAPGQAGAAPAGRQGERQRDAVQAEGAGRRHATPAKAPEPEATDAEHEHDQAETDVQPLFDPKLPPDPNSPFRPKIALVAPRQDDLVDLQQRFPQFELIAVTLDELRSTTVLRTCQRIVGQREDVPFAADDYLRRTFGSRYFRANGGTARVREQLQSWLSNPSVKSADPFRAPKQGNGKGAGGKKRQFRRPRP